MTSANDDEATPGALASSDGGRVRNDLRPTLWLLVFLTLFGVVCAIWHCRLNAAGGLMCALACLATGGAVGFLFGIPKILQGNQQASGVPDAGYRQQVNTNLEEISDWLTKIIVGVGLIELREVPGALSRLGDEIVEGTKSGGAPIEKPFILALIIYFVIVGFLWGYLLTRLFLAGAFSRADRVATTLDRSVDSLKGAVERRELEVVQLVPRTAQEEDTPRDREPTSAEPQPGQLGVSPDRRGTPATDPSDRPVLPNYIREYQALIKSTVSNQDKILSAAILLEQAICSIASKHGVCHESMANVLSIVDQLSNKKVLSAEGASAFRQFWDVRNHVIHGTHAEVDDKQTTRILDLGCRMLWSLSTELGTAREVGGSSPATRASR